MSVCQLLELAVIIFRFMLTPFSAAAVKQSCEADYFS
jgi:hypothetical protein